MYRREARISNQEDAPFILKGTEKQKCRKKADRIAAFIKKNLSHTWHCSVTSL